MADADRDLSAPELTPEDVLRIDDPYFTDAPERRKERAGGYSRARTGRQTARPTGGRDRTRVRPGCRTAHSWRAGRPTRVRGVDAGGTAWSRCST